MEELLSVSVLRGLSARNAVLEIEIEKQSICFELMLAIMAKTGLHWRRQRLLVQGEVLSETMILADVAEGLPAMTVLLIHTDHTGLEMISDRDVALALTKRAGDALRFLSDELKADREVVLSAVEQETGVLKYASKALRDDREIVEKAIALDPSSFANVGSLKNDRGLARAALADDPSLIQFVGSRLRKDKSFVLPFVQRCGLVLQHLPEFKSNKKIVLEAVVQDGESLKFASGSLQDCDEVVRCAVQQKGTALAFASDRLRAQSDIVMAAMGQDSRALRYAVGRNACCKAVRCTGQALKYAAWEFRDDAEVVRAAFTQDPTSLQFAGKTAVMSLVSEDYTLLHYAKQSLRQDADVLLAAKASCDVSFAT